MKNIIDYFNLHSISNIYFKNISRRMEKSIEEYRKNEVKGFGNFNERYSSAIDEGLEKVLAGKDENTFNGFAGNVLFSYNSGTGQLGFFVTESCLYSEEDIKANRAAAYVLDEIFRKTTALLEEDDDKTDKNIESICNSATKMPLVYMNTAVLDTENRTEKCYILQKKKVESYVPDDIHVSKDIKTIKEYNRRLIDEGQENERVAFEDAKNRGAAIFETFDEVFSLRYPKKNNADGQAVAKAKIRPMPDKCEKQRSEKDDSMELLKYVSKKIFRIESSSDFLHAKRFSKCEDARNFLALDDRNLWKSLSEDFRQATADMDKETLFALRHISGPVDKNQNMKIWTNNQRNTPTSKQGLVIGDIDLLSVRFDDGMIHIALHEAKSGNKVLSRSQAEIFRLIRNFLSIGESLNVTVCGVKFSLEDNERFSLYKEEDEISGEKALRNSCRGINIFTSKREFRKDNETARPVTTASKRCKNFCCLSGFGGAASPKGTDTFAAMLAEKYPSTAKNLLNLAESSYSFFTGLFGTEKTRNGAGKDESGKKAKKEVIVKEKEIEEFVFDR